MPRVGNSLKFKHAWIKQLILNSNTNWVTAYSEYSEKYQQHERSEIEVSITELEDRGTSHRL